MVDFKTAPPGQHRCDPYKSDIDAVGFALERLQTMLTWIEEHRASFEKLRESDPVEAEKELHYLADTTKQARDHFVHLAELLLAGYIFDPSKHLPKGLFQPAWYAWVQSFLNDPGREAVEQAQHTGASS